MAKDKRPGRSSIFQFDDVARRGDAEGGEGGFVDWGFFERNGSFDGDSYKYDVDGEDGDILRRRCPPEGEEDAAETEAGDQDRAQG